MGASNSSAKVDHKNNLPHSRQQSVSEWIELKPGDHICWERSIGYQHHAIISSVDADNRTLIVIEYGGNFGSNLGGKVLWSSNLASSAGAKAVVREREEKIEDLGKARLFRCIYDDPKQCFKPEETVERARGRFGEKEYNLFKKNCEHFATWCKTGKAFSVQAIAAAAGGATVGTAVGTAVATTAGAVVVGAAAGAALGAVAGVVGAAAVAAVGGASAASGVVAAVAAVGAVAGAALGFYVVFPAFVLAGVIFVSYTVY